MERLRCISARALFCSTILLFISVGTVRADDKGERKGSIPPITAPSTAAVSVSSSVPPGVTVAPIPRSIPPLPGPRETGGAFSLTAKNVEAFEDILLAPIATWIKNGKLGVKVFRSLDFPWQLNASWKRETITNVDRVELDQSRSLTSPKLSEGETYSYEGFPFGFATNINREKDPVVKAYKILWNVQYGLGVAPEQLYDIELSWIGTQSVLRKATGIYYRRFNFGGESQPVENVENEKESKPAEGGEAAPAAPAAEQPAGGESGAPKLIDTPKPDYMMQEVLKLGWPPVVFGFSQISWRERGTKPDLVWLHSPVIGRNRQVFDSNRSDPLLGGLLTYDDLFVWSGKVQSVNARVVEEKTLLVPFPAVNMYRLAPEQAPRQLSAEGMGGISAAPGTPMPPALPGGLPPAKTVAAPAAADGGAGSPETLAIRGYHKRVDSSAVTVLWNHETGEFVQGALWAPTTVSFVPRRVWVLEISPRDPFYLAGRQILIVDQEAMVPVYKVIFSQGGDYQRTVMGGWSLASTEDGKNRFSFLGFTVAVEADQELAMSLTTHAVKSLSRENKALLAEYREMLDINSYAEEKGSDEASAKKESPGEGEEETPAAPKPPAEPVTDAGGF